MGMRRRARGATRKSRLAMGCAHVSINCLHWQVWVTPAQHGLLTDRHRLCGPAPAEHRLAHLEATCFCACEAAGWLYRLRGRLSGFRRRQAVSHPHRLLEHSDCRMHWFGRRCRRRVFCCGNDRVLRVGALPSVSTTYSQSLTGSRRDERGLQAAVGLLLVRILRESFQDGQVRWEVWRLHCDVLRRRVCDLRR